MKRFITRFTLILAFALPFLVLDSCTKEEDMPNSATLASEVVDSESVGQFLSVETGGLWSISVQNSSPEGWVEVTPSSGQGSNNAVMVLYSKNDTTYSRVADLRVWFEDGQTITLHLEQKGKASVKVRNVLLHILWKITEERLYLPLRNLGNLQVSVNLR